MEVLPHDLGVLLSEGYGLHGEATRVAAGVSGSTLWRVEAPRLALVRVSEHFDLQHIVQVCDDVSRLAQNLPEVVAPLVAVDGRMAFQWNDRPVSVWPFITGVPLDRYDHGQVGQAARLLARLHQESSAQRSEVHDDGIPGVDNAAAAADLLADTGLDDWLDQCRTRSGDGNGQGWRHGDFFWQNILCHEGAVVGLVDWDDISFGPTDIELAWAMWEFSKSARGDRLIPGTAAAFLAEYRQAGGRTTPLADLVPLVRERLRRDIAFFRRIAASHGYVIDRDDESSKFEAFRSLASEN